MNVLAIIFIACIYIMFLEARSKKERQSLEIKVERQAQEIKSAEFERISRLYRFIEFGKLSGGVFHDIVNPLTALTLTMENITYAEKNRKHKEVAETAFRASKRIEAIIATARKELDHEGAKSLFALENEAHEAAELLSHASKASRVDIQIESDGNTMMWGNHVKFFQVAVNLISNGIDSYKGLSDRAKKKRAVVIKISRTDTHVQFKVEDNGCGMSKEIREMIFEPFFTTKTDGNGIGLGLSTTKSIIEKEFSGSIELKSEPGVGSLFCVTMPIRENEAKHRA